jgi:kynurenine formamidase
LLDIPADAGRPWLEDGEAILPEDLERSEARAGLRVGRGDILFVRTGYRRRLPDGPAVRHAPRPGLGAACLPWLQEREVAVLGSDVPIDVFPHGYDDLGLPIHAVGMWAMGLWLLDNCDLERLADHCARIGRAEFLVVLGPLALTAGSGSPINPIAVM